MYKIAIIVAMEKEKKPLLKMCENIQEEKHFGQIFITGDYKNKKIIITEVGIGKVNAAFGMTLLMQIYMPNLVINSGIAGGYKRQLKPLDIVIAEKLFYSDVDMTTVPGDAIPYGQIENMPRYYSTANEILRGIELPKNTYFGNIATGDQFMTSYCKATNIVKIKLQDDNIFAFDMESTAIAHIAYLFKVPLLVIRSISDLIGSKEKFEYLRFAEQAAVYSSDLVKKIIDGISLL